jgi:thioesterase domain-containing protein
MHGCDTELIQLTTCGAGPTIFCVHDYHFRDFASAMTIPASIYGLRLLNLDDADVDLSVEDVAESHVQAIEEIRSRDPIVLIGYSLGGLVAFEMARILANNGRNIPLLVLLDAPHPSFRRNLSSADLKVVNDRYLRSRIKKYIINFARGRVRHVASDLGLLLSKKVKKLIWRFRHILGTPGFRIPQSLRLDGLWHSYDPQPLNGRLVVFWAEGRNTEFGNDPTMGWIKSARGGVDVKFAGGTHETIIKRPNVDLLVQQLLAILDKLQHHG